MADVRLRAVEDDDLAVFFDHQSDRGAQAMAAFPARGEAEFAAHWAKIRADPAVVQRTVVADGAVAGNVVSWEQDGLRLIGYWIGREHWGRGVATKAVGLFVAEQPTRPVHAHVATHNAGSIRVLEKCGFVRDHALEAEAPEPADGIEEFVYTLDE